jgi:excisionase family DNA binding protein
METITKRGFSPAEIAKMLGVSMATIYREIDKGKLQCVRVGTRRVITKWDLETYIGKERTEMLLEEENHEESDQMVKIVEKERLAKIDAAMGMFAHLTVSVDNFLKEKQKDIDIENRHFENRGEK